jgi:hypothetical protein
LTADCIDRLFQYYAGVLDPGSFWNDEPGELVVLG